MLVAAYAGGIVMSDIINTVLMVRIRSGTILNFFRNENTFTNKVICSPVSHKTLGL